jgi:hypothetical protein
MVRDVVIKELFPVVGKLATVAVKKLSIFSRLSDSVINTYDMLRDLRIVMENIKKDLPITEKNGTYLAEETDKMIAKINQAAIAIDSSVTDISRVSKESILQLSSEAVILIERVKQSFPPLAPEASVSTNSTISALVAKILKISLAVNVCNKFARSTSFT